MISSLSPVMEEQVTLCELILHRLSRVSSSSWPLEPGRQSFILPRPFSSHVAATALICILLLTPHALISLVGIEFVLCLHVCWFDGGSVFQPTCFCSINQVLERAESGLVATTTCYTQFKSSNSVTRSQSPFQR